jgi:hypothetical protein
MAPIAGSKLTAQGQVSVPAVVRRAGRYSSEDVHRALFPKRAPKRRSLEQIKDGIRRYTRRRQAGR